MNDVASMGHKSNWELAFFSKPSFQPKRNWISQTNFRCWRMFRSLPSHRSIRRIAWITLKIGLEKSAFKRISWAESKDFQIFELDESSHRIEMAGFRGVGYIDEILAVETFGTQRIQAFPIRTAWLLPRRGNWESICRMRLKSNRCRSGSSLRV